MLRKGLGAFKLVSFDFCCHFHSPPRKIDKKYQLGGGGVKCFHPYLGK